MSHTLLIILLAIAAIQRSLLLRPVSMALECRAPNWLVVRAVVAPALLRSCVMTQRQVEHHAKAFCGYNEAVLSMSNVDWLVVEVCQHVQARRGLQP